MYSIRLHSGLMASLVLAIAVSTPAFAQPDNNQAMVDLDLRRAETKIFDLYHKVEGRSCHLNIGTLQAGDWVSTVAGFAEMACRISFIPGESMAETKQTVERIINYFPPHQHDLIRMQLSMVLEGVVAQRLGQRKGGGGRVPAIELMLKSPSIKDMLREGRTTELTGIAKSATEGAVGREELQRRLERRLHRE